MERLAFGYAQTEITPPRGLSLEGYEFRGAMGAGHAGVLDALSARALSVFAGGDLELLLISLDVCEFVPELGSRFRRAISNRTGLSIDRIMIAATHTHSGPVLDNLWGSRDLSPKAAERHEQELESYLDSLEEALAVIAAQAREDRRPGRISAARFSAVLGYNRRLPAGDHEEMLFGLWEHPNEHPTGPYDPDIPVLLIEAEAEPAFDSFLQPRVPERVVIFNVAAHPVVLGQASRMVSADYPGAARRVIEDYLGPATSAMFVLGACGDTHPFLATQANPRAVAVTGMAVGAGIVTALADRTVLTSGRPTVAVRSDRVDSIELQVFAAGGFAIVGISAELFTEYGLTVKNRSPFRLTMIASLANGTVGYVPTATAYSGGNYEVAIAERAGIGPDTLDRLVERTLSLLADVFEEVGATGPQ